VAFARVGSVTLKKGKTYVCTRVDSVNISQVLGWRPETTTIAWNTNNPITPTEDMVVEFAVYMKDISAVGDTSSIYLQVEESEVSTGFETYINPTTATLNACGKNILSRPYFDGDYMTRDGITATVNADGSVHLIGTATANVYYRLAQMDLGSATILSGSSNGTWALTNCVYDSANKFIYHQIHKGDTVDKVIYPQIEHGAVVTAYESPIESVTYTPTSDGTVDIDAVYPNMTLYTNKNVNIEVEYNVDSNIYLQEIRSLINTGGSQFNANLTDSVTGDVYSLGIANGKLTMTKLEV
jgi:hypothetical protein